MEETLEFNEWGLTRATQIFLHPFDQAAAEIDKRKTHPQYTYLKRKSGTVTREEAGIGKINISFEGIPPETDEKRYRLRASVAQAPLEAHPDFNDFATPANGATFDDEGNFTGWEIELGGNKNPFYGVEAWLVPGAIYEEVWTRGRTSNEGSEFENTGEIDTPPNSGARIRIDGRNWLFLGGEVELIGDGSRMTRRWRLSGPDGWNEDIYTDIGS